MVGLPVAVFLHNRFSGLLLFSLLRRSHQVRLAGLLLVGPAIYQQRLSFFDSAYISLRCYVYTPCSMLRSARGGLYLNNIHELRYTRQIYCSDTRGFSEAPEPTTTLSFSLRLLSFPFFFGNTQSLCLFQLFPFFDSDGLLSIGLRELVTWLFAVDTLNARLTLLQICNCEFSKVLLLTKHFYKLLCIYVNDLSFNRALSTIFSCHIHINVYFG